MAYLFNHGVSAEQMPDHTDLSESQIENIVSYLDSESTNSTELSLSERSGLTVVKPYKNKKSIIDKIIYLNFDQFHTPIKGDDTLTWSVVFLFIGCLIALLCVLVHVNELLQKISQKRYNSTK